jgi:hypothetical protein
MQGLSFSQLKIDSETYIGSMLDTQPHGLGTLSHDEWPSNSTVHGSWLGSRIEGYAEKTLPQGDWYKGWWKDNKLHGQGSYGWNDGQVYSGNWLDNMRSGYGVMKLPDRSRRVCLWLEDKPVETIEQIQGFLFDFKLLRKVNEGIYHSQATPQKKQQDAQSR